ncbi:hypothetical protein COP1_006148 [Malus domestica]
MACGGRTVLPCLEKLVLEDSTSYMFRVSARPIGFVVAVGTAKQGMTSTCRLALYPFYADTWIDLRPCIVEFFAFLVHAPYLVGEKRAKLYLKYMGWVLYM